MDRNEAEGHVKSLYGLQEPWLFRVLGELGTEALSDAGVIRLAELHLAEERRRGAEMDRKEREQHKYENIYNRHSE